MSDFSDPVRQRETRIQELEDTLDRTEKRLKEVREELRALRRREEILDADAEDVRRQLTHEKQEDERQRIMSEIQERKDK